MASSVMLGFSLTRVRQLFLGKNFLWVGLLAIGVAMWLPTSHRQIITEGTDTYATHYPLFGSKNISQTITFDHPVSGIGVIAVNLRRAAVLPPVEVKVFTSADQLLTQTVINPAQIHDDTFAWADFPIPIPADQPMVRLQLTAPAATTANPIGIRFDAERDKHIALALVERVPLFSQFPLWAVAHPDAAHHLWLIIAGSVVVASGLGILTAHKKSLSAPKLSMILVLLWLVAVAIRIPLLVQIDSVFGGDAFNYQLKTLAWLAGDDPFAADPRKGPVYSFLLLPGMVMADPLLWGKLITIVAGASTSVLIVLILRRWALPLPYAVGAGLLLAVNRQFSFESVHALANIPYAALVMATVAAFVYEAPYLVGVVGGLTTLTRYEGGLVAAVLMPVLWLQTRFSWSILKKLLLPLLIVLAIPWLLWPFSGASGVRSWSDVTSDEGLFLATSKEDFINNYKEWRQIAGRMWILTPGIGHQFRIFILGSIAGYLLSWWGPRFNQHFKWLRALAPWLVIGSIGWLLVRHNGLAYEQLANLFGALMGLGLGALWYRWPKYTVPLTLVAALQILVVTAILPKDRYYVHLVPFMAMLVAWGLFLVSGWPRLWTKKIGILLALGMLISVAYFDSVRTLPGLVDEYNGKSREMTVVLQAARWLRPQTGNITAVTDFLPLRTYTPHRLHVYSLDANPDFYQWIKAHRIQYVVELSLRPHFSPFIAEHAARFRFVKTFAASNGQDRATIYEIVR